MIFLSRKDKEIVEGLRVLRELNGDGNLPTEILKLKKQIADLEIQKFKKEEDFARQERELRHMIGLEKKRQEWEIEVAKKDTALTVREGNLVAERKQFDEHLAFNTSRFEKMETYLKEMMVSILERLPNVNVELNRRTR